MRRTLPRLLSAACLLVALSACAPSLRPLYHDYTAPDTASRAVHDSIRVALREAGWSLSADAAPGVVATQARTVQQWGLYRVDVSLEVLPMGDEHVRVFIHPYRRYITGHRSKIPFLPGGVRRAVVPDLDDAFEQHGLAALETPRRRDHNVVR